MAWDFSGIWGWNGIAKRVKTALIAFADATSGHDHDGSDSKKISEANLVKSASTKRTAIVTATAAEINAGKTILSPVATYQYTVTGFKIISSGAFAGPTGIFLVGSATTDAVTAASIAVGALTDGAYILPDTSGVTRGAGFLGALGAGEGLKIIKNGSSATAGTNVKVEVEYTITES